MEIEIKLQKKEKEETEKKLEEKKLEEKKLEEKKLEEKKLEEKKEKLIEFGEIIELNVGGVLFSTYRSTLCSQPQSFLASLFNGRFSHAKDIHGRVFLDRDPKVFEVLLNYLRSQHEEYLESFPHRNLLLEEAHYFGIKFPDSFYFPLPISWSSSAKHNDVMIVDNTKFTIDPTAIKQWNPFRGIRSSESFSSGIHSFMFKVSRSDWYMIAVVTKEFDSQRSFQSGANPIKNCWAYRGGGSQGYIFMEYDVKETSSPSDFGIEMELNLEEYRVYWKTVKGPILFTELFTQHDEFYIYVAMRLGCSIQYYPLPSYRKRTLSGMLKESK